MLRDILRIRNLSSYFTRVVWFELKLRFTSLVLFEVVEVLVALA